MAVDDKINDTNVQPIKPAILNSSMLNGEPLPELQENQSVASTIIKALEDPNTTQLHIDGTGLTGEELKQIGATLGNNKSVTSLSINPIVYTKDQKKGFESIATSIKKHNQTLIEWKEITQANLMLQTINMTMNELTKFNKIKLESLRQYTGKKVDSSKISSLNDTSTINAYIIDGETNKKDVEAVVKRKKILIIFNRDTDTYQIGFKKKYEDVYVQKTITDENVINLLKTYAETDPPIIHKSEDQDIINNVLKEYKSDFLLGKAGKLAMDLGFLGNIHNRSQTELEKYSENMPNASVENAGVKPDPNAENMRDALEVKIRDLESKIDTLQNENRELKKPTDTKVTSFGIPLNLRAKPANNPVPTNTPPESTPPISSPTSDANAPPTRTSNVEYGTPLAHPPRAPFSLLKPRPEVSNNDSPLTPPVPPLTQNAGVRLSRLNSTLNSASTIDALLTPAPTNKSARIYSQLLAETKLENFTLKTLFPTSDTVIAINATHKDLSSPEHLEAFNQKAGISQMSSSGIKFSTGMDNGKRIAVILKKDLESIGGTPEQKKQIAAEGMIEAIISVISNETEMNVHTQDPFMADISDLFMEHLQKIGLETKYTPIAAKPINEKSKAIFEVFKAQLTLPQLEKAQWFIDAKETRNTHTPSVTISGSRPT